MFVVKPEQLNVDLTTSMLQIQTLPVFITLMFLMNLSWKESQSKKKPNFDPPASFSIVLVSVIAVALTFLFVMEWGTQHFLLATEFGLGIALGFANSTIALCFFVANQFLRPWEIMEPNDLILAMPRALGILTLGSWLFNGVRKSNFRLFFNSSNVWLLLFSGWLYVTTFKSPDPSWSQSLYFDLFTKDLLLFFLVFNMIQTKVDIEALSLTVVMSVCGIALSAIYYSIQAPPHAEDPERIRSISMIGNSNDLAAIMVMVFPVVVKSAMQRTELWGWVSRAFNCVVLALTLTVIWWSKSRGALLAVLSISAFYFISRVKNKKKAAIVVVLLACSFLPLISFLKRSEADANMSTASRTLYWKTAIYMALKNPVVGVGYTGYPANFERYAPETPFEWGHRTAHSSWFLVLGETGFVGLFFYLGLFVSAFRKSVKLKAKKFEIYLLFVGYLIAMSFLSHSYVIYPYFVLAFVLGAARVYSEDLLSKKALN